MKKVIVFTAEPENFVPVELKKSAEEQGLECQILDVKKCVLIEDLAGKNEGLKLESKVYFVEEDGALTPVEVDSETAVIPRLNEYHTEIKLGILKRFEKSGATLLNTAESMELCNDKLMTQVILNSAGIKTPYSVMIQGVDEIEKVVTTLEKQEKIKYPYVIKTLRGTHGIGVMKVDSRASLVSVAQLLAKEGIDFMLQEFCKHERSARIIMIGDQMLAANLRGQPKAKDEFRTNSHLGSETEKYEPKEEELAVARQIVELFGCNFCAVDYLITETGVIILEVNGSPGLENIQKNWPDKNLAGEVINFVNGGKPGDAKPVVSPKAEPTVNQGVTPSEVKVSTNDEAVVSAEPSAQAPEDLPPDAIGEIEQCTVHRIIDSAEARIDTGATYSSIHVDKVDVEGDWVKFTRGDVTYKVPLFKTVKIKNVALGTSVPRPVVKLDISIKDKRLNQIEFTLNDRSTMKYEILIGRNALSGLGIPVIVYKDPNSDTTSDESEIVTVEEE